MELSYKKLINIFYNHFPEVIEEKQNKIKQLEWEIGENLVYAFYEEVVKACFSELVAEKYAEEISPHRHALFIKFIGFFEQMAQSDDVEVRNVLGIAIFEDFSQDADVLRFLRNNLMPKSKAMFLDSWNIQF